MWDASVRHFFWPKQTFDTYHQVEARFFKFNGALVEKNQRYRYVVIPMISIYCFSVDILSAGGALVEKVAQTCHALYLATVRDRADAKKHLFHSIMYGLAIIPMIGAVVASPLIGVYDAYRNTKRIVKDPIKQMKQYQLYAEAHVVRDRLITPGMDKDQENALRYYISGMSARIVKKIKDSLTHKEFCQIKIDRTELIAEIERKMECRNLHWRKFQNHWSSISAPTQEEVTVMCDTANAAWRKYQEELNKATFETAGLVELKFS